MFKKEDMVEIQVRKYGGPTQDNGKEIRKKGAYSKALQFVELNFGIKEKNNPGKIFWFLAWEA